VAKIYAALGETDMVFRWLDRAYAERSWRLAYAGTDTVFRSLWTDPRWEDLSRRMNLSP
jgi:hypothetical protein